MVSGTTLRISGSGEMNDYGTEKKNEAHSLNQYNNCTQCHTFIPKSVTLKPNNKAYLNSLSWAKIKVKKKGYLRICIYGSHIDSDSWSLYNKNKLPYDDAINMEPNMCVPVKKGTYYLKVNGDYGIKYTFTKKTVKNNDKRSKAISLKKNKAFVALTYPPKNKKIWTGYYKVKLSKKQFLRLLVGERTTIPGVGGFSFEINIYNSKGKRIPWESYFGTTDDKNNMIITSEKLKKGTYCIELKRYYGTAATRLRYLGSVIALKWK